MKAVVLIPTFNEKENILLLLPRLLDIFKKVRKWELEILVVDDNSPDGTAIAVSNFSKRRNGIHLLVRNKKEGLGAAYLAGMRQAFDHLKADVVLVMDADLSHNPDYIPSFLEKLEDGCDFVVGSRYIRGGDIAKGWAPHRKFLSVFGNVVVPFMLGTRALSDWTSGYRAINKQVFRKVAPVVSKSKRELRGYTFNIAFAYHTVVAGFRVGEVPIKFIDRTAGRSKLGLEYLFHTPVFLFRTRLGMLVNGILKI